MQMSGCDPAIRDHNHPSESIMNRTFAAALVAIIPALISVPAAAKGTKAAYLVASKPMPAASICGWTSVPGMRGVSVNNCELAAVDMSVLTVDRAGNAVDANNAYSAYAMELGYASQVASQTRGACFETLSDYDNQTPDVTGNGVTDAMLFAEIGGYVTNDPSGFEERVVFLGIGDSTSTGATGVSETLLTVDGHTVAKIDKYVDSSLSSRGIVLVGTDAFMGAAADSDFDLTVGRATASYALAVGTKASCP
jgi:hypothetical protein